MLEHTAILQPCGLVHEGLPSSWALLAWGTEYVLLVAHGFSGGQRCHAGACDCFRYTLTLRQGQECFPGALYSNLLRLGCVNLHSAHIYYLCFSGVSKYIFASTNMNFILIFLAISCHLCVADLRAVMGLLPSCRGTSSNIPNQRLRALNCTKVKTKKLQPQCDSLFPNSGFGAFEE